MDALWITGGLAGGVGMLLGSRLGAWFSNRSIEPAVTPDTPCHEQSTTDMQGLLDTIESPIGIQNASNGSWRLNRACLRLLGISADATAAETSRALTAFLPPTMQAPPWQTEQAWTEQVARPGPPESLHRVTLWPLRDQACQIKSRIVMIQDLSVESRLRTSLQRELDQQRREVETTRQELERQRHDQERLVANISHEVRTPLNHILAYATCLTEGMFGPLTSEQEDALEKVARGAERINNLVNDVLDFARLESGRVHLDLQPCPIDIWIDQAMQYFSAQAIRRGIRFEKVLAPDLPVVDGDLEKLTQVVGNLLSNAFKFTPDGGRIHIEADHIDDVLQLRVTDEGPGIPREFQDRLFERFFQVDGSTTRAHGGTGLGLAIAAHIVHLHHGEIRLESEPGAGATFIVELPVSPAIAKLEGLVSPPEVVATKP